MIGKLLPVVTFAVVISLPTSAHASPDVRPDEPATKHLQRTTTNALDSVLTNYLRTRYEALKSNRAIPLRDFIADPDSTGLSLLAREEARQAMRRESYPASGRIVQTFDLEVSIDSVAYEGDRAVVIATENGIVVTDVTNIEDLARDVRHEMVLTRSGGGWKIVSDTYADEFNPSIVANGNRADELIASMKENIEARTQEETPLFEKANVSASEVAASVQALRAAGFTDSEIEQTVIEPAAERLRAITGSSGVRGKSLTPLSGTARSYNRSLALSYAHSWAFGRNTKQYGDFTNLGGDCTNFVSQVLRAGGAPLDSAGSYQWYYYSMNSRSPSWTGVEQLYSYIAGNTYTGPYGHPASLYDVRPGDIIQFKIEPNRFSHSTVVVSNDWVWSWLKFKYVYVVKLVMHDTNHDYFPLDNFAQYPARYVVVGGYYD